MFGIICIALGLAHLAVQVIEESADNDIDRIKNTSTFLNDKVNTTNYLGSNNSQRKN